MSERGTSLGFMRLLAVWIAAAVLCQMAVALPHAKSAVYWGNGFSIGAANLDGGAPQFNYITGGGSAPHELGGAICDTEVTEDYLYWTASFGMRRVNLKGPPYIESILPGSSSCGGIAVSSSHIYWTDSKTGNINRTNLAGGEGLTPLISGTEPCGVAIDDQYLYWTDLTGIGRAKLDGSGVDHNFIVGIQASCGLAVDDHYIYWGGQSADAALSRAKLDGTNVEDSFIPGVGKVDGIATNADHILWTNRPNGMVFASIGRAKLDGTESNLSWISSNQFSISGVSVDSRVEPLPVLFPSRPVRFGTLKRDRQKGVIVLDIFVPARGELLVTSPKLGWKVLKGPPPPAWRGGSFRWKLKLWPGSTGRASKRIHNQLKRRGRAPVKLWLTYTEAGRAPISQGKRLVLKRRVITAKKDGWKMRIGERERAERFFSSTIHGLMEWPRRGHPSA